MCARYTMATTPHRLIEEFEAILSEDTEIVARYNIAPTDLAPIVAQTSGGERRLGLARFGFIPHWAEDVKVGVRMLNARVETVATSRAYRRAFATRRCLVASDGFYEWARRGKAKIPHRFHLANGAPFAMAGLWSIWRDADETKVSSFTILTRPAVGAVAPFHDRMPILLPRAGYAPWLDRQLPDVGDLLANHRGFELEADEVSTRVGNVRNDDPSLIVPIELKQV